MPWSDSCLPQKLICDKKFDLKFKLNLPLHPSSSCWSKQMSLCFRLNPPFVLKPFCLSCRLWTHPNLLCFRHPFSAEEDSLHHQYQKQKKHNIEHLGERKLLSVSFFELVLKHGMEFCLKEPSLTDQHVQPQPCPLNWTDSHQRGLGGALTSCVCWGNESVERSQCFFIFIYVFNLRSRCKTSKHTGLFLPYKPLF